MKISEKFDFVQWGGLRSETLDDSPIDVSDGVHVKNWKGSEIIYRVSNSDKILSSNHVLIGFNASISSREMKKPPFFTGGNKALKVDAPVLSISDPASHLDGDSYCWYIGTQTDSFFQKHLAEFIQAFCIESQLNPILFGSASGGFASIAISDLLEVESFAIAFNPYTDVRRSYGSSVEKFYKDKWNCSNIEDFSTKLDKHDIMYDLNQLKQKGKSKILILQNILDHFQMENHINTFFHGSFKELNPVIEHKNITLFFGVWGPGHHSPWPEHITVTLSLSSSFSINSIIEYFEKEFYPSNISTNEVKLSDISLSGGGGVGNFSNMMLYKARSDLPYEKIPTYGYHFSKYDNSDRNLAFCLHSLRQIDYLLRDNSITPFSNLIALHHLLSWWGFVNSSAGKESVMAWYDMSSGLRAQKVAYFLDLCGSIPAFKKYEKTLVKIAEAHISWFDKPEFIKYGNHGIFQIHGYMALVKALRRPELKKKVTNMMNTIFECQFSSNLMHVENSPEYHQFVISIFDIYFRTNWYGEDISQKLSSAKIHNYWLVDTENKYICVGDTEPKPLNITENVKQKAIQSSDFLFNKDEVLYHVKTFDITGYLCLKASIPGGNVFFSLSGFASIGHRQADDLSFVLYDQHKWRFDDPGKYTYQMDKRKYINRSHQHNCLTIDGKSHSTKSDDMYESCRENARYDEASGIFSTTLRWIPTAEVTHVRYCLYAPNEFFIVVDQMSSIDEHRYSQWFQIGNSYKKYEQQPSSIQFETEDVADYFRMDFFCSSKEPDLNIFSTNHDMPVGWISKKYLSLEPNIAVEHNVQSKNTELWAVSRFAPNLSMEQIISRIDALELPFDTSILR